MPTTLATYAVSSVSTIKTGSLVKIPVFKGAKGDLGAISTAIFGTEWEQWDLRRNESTL